MKILRLPCDERDVRSLKAGDAVEIHGLVVTGRDALHKFFADGGAAPRERKGAALYHCGSVAVRDGGGWRIAAAGPTTSVRENVYEPRFIAGTGVRVIIGKGGMDDATHEAMKRCGCVYVQAVGGAAALAASCVKKVLKVDHLDDFGAAEACWHLDVAGLRGVVAMDANGGSLFREVRAKSAARMARLLKGAAAWKNS